MTERRRGGFVTRPGGGARTVVGPGVEVPAFAGTTGLPTNTAPLTLSLSKGVGTVVGGMCGG